MRPEGPFHEPSLRETRSLLRLAHRLPFARYPVNRRNVVCEPQTALQVCFVGLSGSIGFEHEITINDNPHGETWPDPQCGLNIQISSDNVLSRLI